MSKRMDKYEQIDKKNVIPKRSEKNKELYKQIYNAYDEFENLVVPSNAKEIDINDLKKEISSRDEYRQIKDVEEITNTKITRIDDEISKNEDSKKEEEIYDINELLDKAVSSNKKESTIEPTLSSGDYLKKLKLDRTKTNLEQVKEMYNDMEDDIDNNDELIKTASLSLEILSDLKGTDDNTAVSAVDPDEIDDIIASESILEKSKDSSEKQDEDDDDFDFYSNNYKFSKKDFDGKKEDIIDKELIKKDEDSDYAEEDDDEDDEYEGGHSFLKIFLLVFGILLVVAIVAYLIIYFGKN